MKTIAVTLPSILMFALAGGAHAALVDGSFELADLGTATTNSSWTLVESAPDGLGASFESFAASDGDLGLWFRPFDGSDAEPASAVLSQTINSVSGGDYLLYFDAAREVNFTAGTFVATFSSSGGLTGSIDLNTAVVNLPSTMFGNPTTFVIPLLGVSAGDNLTITIEMSGGTQALENPQSAFVDNFRLVPEPSSIALSAVALMGFIGLCRRNRVQSCLRA